ncbi:unnamed protein product [Mytilus coruscus]|uniref:Endonuclease/exonuclease/phosphatase domain-containing protein n=1 Tax=Mytilus coruscus TaxID=42192 RepID=A0A6J8BRI0_MYTCO|nr:unnamed protein product [Mytilus coruscus]
MILGDFNARTDTLEDFISNNDDDYNDYVPVPKEYESDKIKQLSDHAKVSVRLLASVQVNCLKEILDDFPMKFKWETISPELFLYVLKSEEIKVKIQDFKNIQTQSQSEVEAVLHSLHYILKMAANKSLKRKTKSRRNGIKSKPWFDKGLSSTRKELDHKSQMLARYPKDPIIRGNFFKFRKLYGKKCKLQYKQYKLDIIQKLDNLFEKNPSKYWEFLNKLKYEDENKLSSNSIISADEWFKHFKELNTVLRRTCNSLRAGVFSTFTDYMLETACKVAFFELLRCGEFTVSKHFDSTVNLSVLDSYAILHLKISKTDPFHKSVSIQLHKSDHTVCSFSAIKKYFAIRKVREESFCFSYPLFVKENGSALDRDFFIRSLKHVLDKYGYISSLYDGHSFRIGDRTSAGSVNIQDHLIKHLVGGHRTVIAVISRFPRTRFGKHKSL